MPRNLTSVCLTFARAKMFAWAGKDDFAQRGTSSWINSAALSAAETNCRVNQQRVPSYLCWLLTSCFSPERQTPQYYPNISSCSNSYCFFSLFALMFCCFWGEANYWDYSFRLLRSGPAVAWTLSNSVTEPGAVATLTRSNLNFVKSQSAAAVEPLCTIYFPVKGLVSPQFECKLRVKQFQFCGLFKWSNF